MNNDKSIIVKLSISTNSHRKMAVFFVLPLLDGL